jgi:cell division protein FtsQ
MKFKFKFSLKRELKIAGVLLVILLLIAFTERKQGSVAIQDIQIKIENTNDNHFLDDGDVNHLMALNHENLRGASLNKVGLKDIEKKIKLDRFVKDAQLYTDIKGNLVVNVELRRPIARIVRNDGPDGYIAEDGTIMPVSEKFSSRVVLISGLYVRKLLQQENINSTEEGKQLMQMIDLIREDDFWKAQVTELDIDSKMRINIIPEVGDEKIEFGKPENIEQKFKKLKIFYKEILPTKGWSRYKRVNLEYEGQIVAE